MKKVLMTKTDARKRNNGHKLDKFRLRKETGRNSCTNKMINEWNENVVEAETILLKD